MTRLALAASLVLCAAALPGCASPQIDMNVAPAPLPSSSAPWVTLHPACARAIRAGDHVDLVATSGSGASRATATYARLVRVVTVDGPRLQVELSGEQKAAVQGVDAELWCAAIASPAATEQDLPMDATHLATLVPRGMRGVTVEVFQGKSAVPKAGDYVDFFLLPSSQDHTLTLRGPQAVFVLEAGPGWLTTVLSPEQVELVTHVAWQPDFVLRYLVRAENDLGFKEPTDIPSLP